MVIIHFDDLFSVEKVCHKNTVHTVFLKSKRYSLPENIEYLQYNLQ